ncbi:MAG: sulfurtransferase [Acidimicrobiia bacterium]
MIAPIIDVEQLATALRSDPPTLDGRPVVLADVRWYLDGRSGLDAYRSGHVPGAVWVDLDRWLSEHRSPTDGRHPLPTPETFAEGMGVLGIGDDTVVIAYDDQAGLVAGRLVWMLRRTGHDAAVLDGGLAAWSGPLATGDEAAAGPAPFSAVPWPAEHFLDTADVLAAQGRDDVVIIDARAGERYRGETEPIDPRAGHVPGALSVPLTGNLGDDGRYLPAAALAERYAPFAGKDVIAYCGSGVSACHDLLALEATGRIGKLYVGSWSAWSSTPELPAATGPDA